MSKIMMSRVLVAGVASFALSGCVTTGSGPGGSLTELEKANNECVTSVLVGAAVGAVIGNNIGSGSAGDGALVGAGAGLLVCAVIREAAREREAVMAYQQQAAAAGRRTESSWTAESGKRMSMTTEIVQDEEAAAEQVCRYSASKIQVEGVGTSDLPRQRWCRDADGTWQMA